jgi:hypothetical protein
VHAIDDYVHVGVLAIAVGDEQRLVFMQLERP